MMLAYMNEEALRLTLETGEAHFWSRSRGEAVAEGRDVGDTLKVIELRTDCDQDALLLEVEIGGQRGRLPHRASLLLLPAARRHSKLEIICRFRFSAYKLAP